MALLVATRAAKPGLSESDVLNERSAQQCCNSVPHSTGAGSVQLFAVDEDLPVAVVVPIKIGPADGRCLECLVAKRRALGDLITGAENLLKPGLKNRLVEMYVQAVVTLLQD